MCIRDRCNSQCLIKFTHSKTWMNIFSQLKLGLINCNQRKSQRKQVHPPLPHYSVTPQRWHRTQYLQNKNGERSIPCWIIQYSRFERKFLVIGRFHKFNLVEHFLLDVDPRSSFDKVQLAVLLQLNLWLRNHHYQVFRVDNQIFEDLTRFLGIQRRVIR